MMGERESQGEPGSIAQSTQEAERPQARYRPRPRGQARAGDLRVVVPTCCLRSLKETAMSEVGERRRLELDCSCGRSWRITSSLDARILERFVTHGGPRAGGSYPAA